MERKNAVNREIQDINVYKFLGLTAVSAALRVAVSHPLLVCMSRLQVMQLASAGQAGTSSSLSTWSMLKSLRLEEGGYKNWFRGFPVFCFGVVSTEILYNLMFEVLRSPSSNDTTCGFLSSIEPQALRDGFSCCPGELLTTFAFAPFAFVSSRQMAAGAGVASDIAPRQSFIAVIQQVTNSRCRQHRITGNSMQQTLKLYGSQMRLLFGGVSASILMIVPNALWWPIYYQTKVYGYQAFSEPLKQYVQPNSPQWVPSVFTSDTDNVVINGTAGLVGACAVSFLYNPLLVIRTRMQVLSAPTIFSASVPSATPSFRSVAKSVFRTDGWRGFYRGFLPNAASSCIDFAIFAITYDLMKQLSQRDATAEAA